MFTEWQAEYAKYAVATFPVSVGPEGKKPCVTNYTRVGLRASAELGVSDPGKKSNEKEKEKSPTSPLGALGQ